MGSILVGIFNLIYFFVISILVLEEEITLTLYVSSTLVILTTITCAFMYLGHVLEKENKR